MSELDDGGFPRPPAPEPAASRSAADTGTGRSAADTGPPPPNPWAAHDQWPPSPPPRSRADRVRELVFAALLALGIAALGVPLALLWSAWGPHVGIVMTSA